MRATIFDGSRSDDGFLTDIQSVVVNELSSNGWDTESLTLREMKITHCVGCFQCATTTPGLCRFNDDGRAVARKFIQSDLVVFLSPVTFGGYSSQLKKALDRMICLISPFFTRIKGETHHKKRYDKYPRLLGLGVLSGEDESGGDIFAKLVGRNAINMHSPAHAALVVSRDQSIDSIGTQMQPLLSRLGIS
jgi:multimeric flavodoxin WrbA